MNRILLIDDNAAYTGIVKAWIGERWTLDVASSGKAGLRALHNEHPDLVLLDLMMPEVTGVDVLRAIRSDETLATTPVVMTTAYAEFEEMRTVQNLGVMAVLQKPFSREDLLDCVGSVLQTAGSFDDSATTKFEVIGKGGGEQEIEIEPELLSGAIEAEGIEESQEEVDEWIEPDQIEVEDPDHPDEHEPLPSPREDPDMLAFEESDVRGAAGADARATEEREPAPEAEMAPSSNDPDDLLAFEPEADHIDQPVAAPTWIPPEPDRDPTEHGVLSIVPAPELLLRLKRQGVTGQLFVQTDGWTMRIDLARGSPVRAGGGPRETDLGQTLVRLRYIEPQELEQLLRNAESQTPRPPLGDHAVREGLVTHAQVLAALWAQLESKLRALVPLSIGTFRFYEDADALRWAQSEDTLPLEILIEECLRQEEDVRARCLGPFLDRFNECSMEATDVVSTLLPLFHFGGKVQRLVRLADGQTLDATIDEGVLDRAEAELVLYLLWASGGVNFPDAPDAAPTTSSEEPPVHAQARRAIAEQRYEDADRIILAAGKKNPNDPELLVLAGWVAYLGQPRSQRGAAEASTIIERALGLDPACRSALLALAQIARMQGHFEQAKAHLDRALKQAPDDQELQKEAQVLGVLAGESEARKDVAPAPPSKQPHAESDEPPSDEAERPRHGDGVAKRLFGLLSRKH